jgi:putative ABC transport system substrate-binding protein
MTGGKITIRRLATLSAILLCLAGCATTGNDHGDPTRGSTVIDPPARPGAPDLLIAMPTSINFTEVRKSLVSEVQKNFNIHTLAVGPETKVADLAAAIQTTKPVCIVLMNNATMGLYRQYQATHPTAATPPAVLLMASFVEEVQSHLKRATGIAYEVPGVTAFVNLRSVMNAPINRVGVIYRPPFRKFVEHQKSLAAKEHVEIVAVSVPNDVTAAGLRDAIHGLADGGKVGGQASGKVDAIWMLNDNGLVRDEEFVDDAWRVELSDAKLPLIVGVANFVDPSSPLGTLAVVPDHEALGLQAANLIFDLSENDWQVESHPVELPLSVKTVVDVKQVRANFGLRADALKHIDKALE